MKDRELLELAAKAAGIEGEWRELRSGSRDHFNQIRYKRRNAFLAKGIVFDPLADDGDAFRLAAYLRLEVIPGKHAGDGCSVNSRRHEIPGVTVFRDSKDMAEQMRRAIVMAAAEIGKSIP